MTTTTTTAAASVAKTRQVLCALGADGAEVWYVRWACRLVFAVYVLFTALVLISLLIAMATSRYEKARLQAACTWRFNAVEFGLFIQRQLTRATSFRLRHTRRTALASLFDNTYASFLSLLCGCDV